MLPDLLLHHVLSSTGENTEQAGWVGPAWVWSWGTKFQQGSPAKQNTYAQLTWNIRDCCFWRHWLLLQGLRLVQHQAVKCNLLFRTFSSRFVPAADLPQIMESSPRLLLLTSSCCYDVNFVLKMSCLSLALRWILKGMYWKKSTILRNMLLFLNKISSCTEWFLGLDSFGCTWCGGHYQSQ